MDLLRSSGKSLKRNDGSNSKVAVDGALKPKQKLGLYFSAHWCPPCKAFTPKLVDWYKKQNAESNGHTLEIIFISSDRDEASFADYFTCMPWLALDFAERDLKDELCKKFSISGIPSLVFINGDTGEVITTDGRKFVMGGQKIPAHKE